MPSSTVSKSIFEILAPAAGNMIRGLCAYFAVRLREVMEISGVADLAGISFSFAFKYSHIIWFRKNRSGQPAAEVSRIPAVTLQSGI